MFTSSYITHIFLFEILVEKTVKMNLLWRNFNSSSFNNYQNVSNPMSNLKYLNVVKKGKTYFIIKAKLGRLSLHHPVCSLHHFISEPNKAWPYQARHRLERVTLLGVFIDKAFFMSENNVPVVAYRHYILCIIRVSSVYSGEIIFGFFPNKVYLNVTFTT